MRTARTMALTAALLTACGCTQQGENSQDEVAKVTGTVTYLQRIAPPPDAVVDVTLADVSLQDAPALTIAEQTLTEPGQVPIPFERRGWR